MEIPKPTNQTECIWYKRILLIYSDRDIDHPSIALTMIARISSVTIYYDNKVALRFD